MDGQINTDRCIDRWRDTQLETQIRQTDRYVYLITWKYKMCVHRVPVNKNKTSLELHVKTLKAEHSVLKKNPERTKERS